MNDPTPGPWHVMPGPAFSPHGEPQWCILAGDPDASPDGEASGVGILMAMSEADRRLVVAAPLLLEACRAIDDFLAKNETWETMPYDAWQKMNNAVEAAMGEKP